MYYKQAIQNYPLQVYVSTLLFSPQRSLIRRCFQDDKPKWITIKPAVEDDWNACLQTLEGHSYAVNSVAFSPDSSRLESASHDGTVKIWDASSGKCLQTLEGHSYLVKSVAFSPDSSRLASASWDRTVKIWDANSGKCVSTYHVGTELHHILSFSIDGLCLNTDKGTLSLDFAASNAICNMEFNQAHKHQVVGLSPDGTWITYGSKKVVWLPSERRPGESAVSTDTIGIGVGSGRVWMCSFQTNDQTKSGS